MTERIKTNSKTPVKQLLVYIAAAVSDETAALVSLTFIITHSDLLWASFMQFNWN